MAFSQPTYNGVGDGNGGQKSPLSCPKLDLKQGTELFRKQLEASNALRQKTTGPPVKGGLPPHLLRQQGERPPANTSAGASTVTGPGTLKVPGTPQHAYLTERPSKYHCFQTVVPSESQGDAFKSQHQQSASQQPQTSQAPGQAHDSRKEFGTAGTDSGSHAPTAMKQPVNLQPASSCPVEVGSRDSTTAPAMQTASLAGTTSQQRFPPTPSYTGGKPRNMDFIPSSQNSHVQPHTKGIMLSQWAPHTGPLTKRLTAIPKIATPDRNNGMPLSVSSYTSKDTQPDTVLKEPDNGQKPIHVQPTHMIQASDSIQSELLAERANGIHPSPNAQKAVQDVGNPFQPNKKQKWRPKRSYDLESQSLPDTVSSVQLNDEDPDFRNIDSDSSPALHTPEKDIRGEIADESNLKPTHSGDGFYDASPWKESASENGNWSQNKNWFMGYVSSWINKQAHVKLPDVFFLDKKIERHEECDVNTYNGWLNAPVEYPATYMNPADAKRPQETTRRLSSSANLKSATDYEKNRRRLEKAEKKMEEKWGLENTTPLWQPQTNPFPSPHPPAPQPTAPPRQPMTGKAQIHAGGVISQAPAGPIEPIRPITPTAPVAQPDEFESYLKVSCFLRPAKKNDLARVLKIYNWEVAHGIQALDTKPLTLEDFHRIFEQCKDAQTPFIVVIAGTPAEAAARKEVPATPRGPYQTYREGPYQQHYQNPEQDKVLGFGFITIRAAGLAGGIHHSVGRFQGRLHFYVDNENRRNGVGRALLCRLTKCCSIMMISTGEYDYFDPDRNEACDVAPHNARQYTRLFIEVASRSQNDPDSKWCSKFLNGEGFMCVSTADKARKVGCGEKGIWLDNLIWQHDCQDPKSIFEDPA